MALAVGSESWRATNRDGAFRIVCALPHTATPWLWRHIVPCPADAICVDVQTGSAVHGGRIATTRFSPAFVTQASQRGCDRWLPSVHGPRDLPVFLVVPITAVKYCTQFCIDGRIHRKLLAGVMAKYSWHDGRFGQLLLFHTCVLPLYCPCVPCFICVIVSQLFQMHLTVLPWQQRVVEGDEIKGHCNPAAAT